MNVIDIVLIVLLAAVLVRGWVRGAVSQVAALGGALAGLVGGALAAPALARSLVEGPGTSLAMLTFGLLFGFVLLGQTIGLGLGYRLHRAAESAGVGPVDRGAGVVVGAAGLAVVTWLGASLLVQGPLPMLSQEIRQSRLVGVLANVLPPPPDVIGHVSTYLDQQGFPQVFSGAGTVIAAPVPPTSDEAVRVAAEAGRRSTVRVGVNGCGVLTYGTGFVPQDGFVVTSAHVIAGAERVVVHFDGAAEEAAVIHLDAELDLAVLAAGELTATPIDWADEPADHGTEGATLGFPGGQEDMVVKPATAQARGEAVGRDIYGRDRATREVLTMASTVQRGDSGGPFVTASGTVAGVVFAADSSRFGVGYALTAESVRPEVEAAIARGDEVSTGTCRF